MKMINQIEEKFLVATDDIVSNKRIFGAGSIFKVYDCDNNSDYLCEKISSLDRVLKLEYDEIYRDVFVISSNDVVVFNSWKEARLYALQINEKIIEDEDAQS